MLMLLLLFALVIPPQAAVQSTPHADIALARTTVERLAKGEFAAVVAAFSEKLRAALPEEKLRATWQRLESRVGRLRNIGEAELKDRGNLRGVVLSTQFDKRNIKIEVVFNAAGEIAGLLFD
jgi:uncharacterized protein